MANSHLWVVMFKIVKLSPSLDKTEKIWNFSQESVHVFIALGIKSFYKTFCQDDLETIAKINKKIS